MSGPDLPGVAGERNAALAEAFVALADVLVADYDIVDFMDRLVRACVDLLEATAAGLVLVDQRGSLQVIASSSEEMHLLELFQLQRDEGPCLDCVQTGAPVTVRDLDGAADRWPRFVVEAARVGYQSVHAVPMRLRQDVIGGLNVFRQPGPALDPYEERVARALADIATIGVLQQRSARRAALLAEQLQTALDSRIVIEQAKGVLAEYAGLGMEHAYRALRRHARDRNCKLTALADAVVTGRIPAEHIVPARQARQPRRVD